MVDNSPSFQQFIAIPLAIAPQLGKHSNRLLLVFPTEIDILHRVEIRAPWVKVASFIDDALLKRL